MNSTLIQAKFETLGARAKIRLPIRNRSTSETRPLVIDIKTDRHGEFFDIQAAQSADVQILDVQPRDRHLLLMVRRAADTPGEPTVKDKFLCGHDERHWFVAGIPEKPSASTVITAKEALKPQLVRDLEQGQRGKQLKRHKRKTPTFVRQGEWFFVPAPDLIVKYKLILSNEPLRRGGGKPHNCQYLYREGGQVVYVSRQHPNGLTEPERRQLFRSKPSSERWNWQVMRRDPTVYVRGTVSHRDHATVHLESWHRVLMNTENQSRAATFVAFLD